MSRKTDQRQRVHHGSTEDTEAFDVGVYKSRFDSTDWHFRRTQRPSGDEFLRRYGKEWIVHIEDVSDFVAEQFEHVRARRLDLLSTPEEHVYPVADAEVAEKLGIDA